MHVAKSIIVLQIYEHFYIHTTKTHKKNNTAPDDKLGAVSFHVSLQTPAHLSVPRDATLPLAPVRSGSHPPARLIIHGSLPACRRERRHAVGLRHQPAGQNERTPEYGKSGVLGLKIKTGIKRVSDG